MPVLRVPAPPYQENHSPENCLFSHLEGASCPLGHTHHPHPLSHSHARSHNPPDPQFQHAHHRESDDEDDEDEDRQHSLDPDSSTAASSSAMDVVHRPPKGACRRCHERKVKCDITSLGKPCSACSKDNIPCEPRTRKRYYSLKRQRRSVAASISHPRSPSNTPGPINHHQQLSRQPYHAHSHFGPATTAVPTSSITPSTHINSIAAPGIVPNPILVSSPARSSTIGVASPEQGYAEGSFNDRGLIDSDRLPSYLGNQGVRFILDAAGLKSRDIPITPSMAQGLDQDELEFLQKKGVFTVPSRPVCDELILCYFRYLYPTMPVIDPASFILDYCQYGIEGSAGPNLLLLWSVFHAGASFISDPCLAESGYATRSSLKSVCFEKAKRLFDMSTEKDQIVLIQSALLLSLWMSGPDDAYRSGNWISTAVSLAQNRRLHRNPTSSGRNPGFQHTFLRRLFWTCFYRDRWSALHMGRPLRINNADCDMTLPSEEELTAELESISMQTRVTYGLDIPFAQYWLSLMRLSIYLGDILASNYRPHARPLSYSNIRQLATAIGSCVPPIHNDYVDSETRFQNLQLAFHRDAALITLYRKGASREVLPGEESPNGSERDRCRENIRAASIKFYTNMENLMQSNTLSVISPLIIPLCAPAMLTDLIDAKSPVTKVRALNRLDFWIQILGNLGHNFPAAENLSKTFRRARENASVETATGNIQSRSPSITLPPSIVVQSNEQPPQQGYNTTSLQPPGTNPWDETMYLESYPSMNWHSTPESLDPTEGGQHSGHSSRAHTLEGR